MGAKLFTLNETYHFFKACRGIAGKKTQKRKERKKHKTTNKIKCYQNQMTNKCSMLKG